MYGGKREQAMSNLFYPNTYAKNTDSVKAVEGSAALQASFNLNENTCSAPVALWTD